MRRILTGFRKQKGDGYDLWRLVDQRFLDKPPGRARLQLVCDIDKTYLETEFESLFKMARIAFEDANDKVTVQGASEVLLAARWGNMNDLDDVGEHSSYPRPLHFVSSSPPQLRNVLEEKLSLDGLDWTSDTFKNQAYNLKKGRFDLLKQHVAYKSAAILGIASHFQHQSSMIMLGDNAESDAFIYLGAKLFLEKKLSLEGYEAYLQLAGIEPQVSGDLIKELSEPKDISVKGILIRDLPNYDLVDAPPLTDPIQLFDNFFEASLYLREWELLGIAEISKLARRFHNRFGMPLSSIGRTLSVFSERSSLKESLRKEITALADHLCQGKQESIEPFNEDFKHLESKGLAAFDALTESEILEIGKSWLENIEAEKESKKT